MSLVNAIYVVAVYVVFVAIAATGATASATDNTKDSDTATEIEKSCAIDMLSEAKSEYQKFRLAHSVQNVETSKAINTNHMQKVYNKQISGSEFEINVMSQVLGDNPPYWVKELPEGCTNPACVIATAFRSEEAAYRVLNVAMRTGYVISAEQQKVNTIVPHFVFSPTEIRMIDSQLKKLPRSFYHLPTLKRILRYPPNVTDPRVPSTAAAFADPNKKEIVFYQVTFNHGGPLEIVHEIAHHYDFSNRADGGKLFHRHSGFSNISGWGEGERVINLQKPTEFQIQFSKNPHAKFVRKYSETDPAEDLADAIGYYVTAPEKLKAVDEVKYMFVKNRLFEFKEFESRNEKTENMIFDNNGRLTKEQLVAICVSSFNDKNIFDIAENNQWRILDCVKKSLPSVYRNSSRKAEICMSGGAQWLQENLQSTLAPEVSAIARGLKYTPPELQTALQKTCYGQQLSADCVMRSSLMVYAPRSELLNKSAAETAPILSAINEVRNLSVRTMRAAP